MQITFKTQSGNECEIEISYGDGRAAAKVGFAKPETTKDVKEAKRICDAVIEATMGTCSEGAPLKGSEERIDAAQSEWIGTKH